MNSRTLEMENDATAKELSELQMEPLIRQIWKDMQGTVEHATIERELREVIPTFASARIKTFVPIFVRRNTVNRLRAAMAGTGNTTSRDANI